MSYKQLSLAERYYIEVEGKKKVSQSKIAETLGRSQGKISRELKRNSGKKGYRNKQADCFAHERHAFLKERRSK